MALTPLTHKRLASVVPASNAINDLLDAIASALQATTYYDGTSRTPGSGDAWSVTLEVNTDTVALKCRPPLGGSVDDLAIVLAGVASGSYSPSFISSDTFAVDNILGGVFRNVPGSPTYNGWDNSSPYTGADFTGYAKVVASDSFTINYIIVIESSETLAVIFKNSANSVHLFHAGAILEAAQTNEGESNGRLYGLFSTGGGNTLGITMHTNGVTSNGSLYGHLATNGSIKSVTLDPQTAGNSTQLNFSVPLSGSYPISTSRLAGKLGSQIGWPIHCVDNTASTANFIGVVRQVYRVSDQIGFPVFREGSTDRMYIVSSSANSTNDAIGFGA